MNKLILKITAVFCVLAMTLSGLALAEETAMRVVALKGPTAMGLVKLMEDDKEAGSYHFDIIAAVDEVAPLLVKGEADVACVPANLASVLYNNTEGAVQVLAVNTLGVLYIVENGETISSVADLKGKTIYSTGKGTTPEFALNYILTQNGLSPETDLTIEYKSEATEVLAALTSDSAAIGVLPQPYVTAALAQSEGLRVALDLTEEWDRVSDDSRLITGVAVVRSEFLEAHPEMVTTFLSEYAASVDYVNQNPAEAAEWIADLGIVAKAPIAQKALPACNIVCVTGDEMKTAISGYLEVLFGQDPASVGGALPNEDFYYVAP